MTALIDPSLTDILEEAHQVRCQTMDLLTELKRRNLLVPRTFSRGLFRNRLRGILLESHPRGKTVKVSAAETLLRILYRMGMDNRTPEEIRENPRIVLETEQMMRFFAMELMNKVGDEAYNEEWGIQGWSIAEKLMHRAEVSEYVCERVLKHLGVEDFAGERVVEVGVGNGTACLPYVARGATVTGYDANLSMVKKTGRTPRILTKIGNPNVDKNFCNEVPDGSVQVFLLMGVNRYLSNSGQENLFHAVARTLKETGFFVAGLWKPEREAAVNLWGPEHRTFPWDFEQPLESFGLEVKHAEYVIHGEGDYFPAWFLYIGKKNRSQIPAQGSDSKKQQRIDYKKLKKKRLAYSHYERSVRDTERIAAALADNDQDEAT